MGTRARGSVVAPAVLAALSWAAPASAAGQAWTPTRTPDGQPDIQGIWVAGPGANNAGHSLEEGCCEPDHNRMQNRAADNIGLRQQIILDPPNGQIPFQPWAAAKRREHLVNPCWEGVSITNRLDAGRMAVRAGKTGIHSHQER